MKIVVGSKNPVKVEAVEEAFKKYWSDSEVVGVEVESGVASQPMNEQETMDGARNRAKACIGSGNYGVGIEGGVCEIEGKMFECAWVCVIDRNGVEGLGGGLYFELPDKVATLIRAGGELGPLMDEFTGKINVKQGSGAIGIFTKGKLDRKGAYVQIMLSEMIKYVGPESYS